MNRAHRRTVTESGIWNAWQHASSSSLVGQKFSRASASFERLRQPSGRRTKVSARPSGSLASASMRPCLRMSDEAKDLKAERDWITVI